MTGTATATCEGFDYAMKPPPTELIKSGWLLPRRLNRDEATAISEIEIVAGLIRKLVDENAHAAIDPDEYDRRYNELLAQYDNAKARVTEIEERRSARKARKRDLEAFYKVLKMTGPLAEFDEGVWNVAVERALVYSKGLVTFAFQNGCEIL